MANFSKECIETFLNKQLQLFDEKVAETPQEAEEFLEDNLAVVLDSIEDVRDYLDESGMDAAQLSKRSTGRTIYILDEPTTGLHFADVHKLIEILQRLAEGGNTVVVIEHNLDVIKTADYIIDIGPEGGDKGGTVIAKGTPEEVAKAEKSYTGKYVKKYL